MYYSDRGEMAFIYETVARIETTGNQDDLIRVLSALADSDHGAKLFFQKDYSGAVRKFETALKEINGINEAVTIRALIQRGLVSAYARTGRFEQALESGNEALKYLTQDKRLSMAYADCLHDIGSALVESEHIKEGLEYLERALRTYETLPDGADRAANCLDNIDKIKAHLESNSESRKSSRGLLSRLFGS